MPPTLAELLREMAATLAGHSLSAQADAKVLLQHATGSSATDLVVHANREVDEEALRHIRDLLARRLAGEPIAYLTGVREFWSMTLTVSSAVLIPRPETELLVERALAHIPANAHWTVVDAGTGSGAIALALAHERPHCRLLALDASSEALTVARTNALRHALGNIEFREGRWLEPLGVLSPEMIVSNPPYVSVCDPHLEQGDLRYEPQSALVGGLDGLEAIRELATQAFTRLMPGGWLLLEHGHDQALAVANILTEAGFCEIACYHDFAGHARVTECRAAPTGC